MIGEKDLRYEDQYPAGLPFVFFLVPRQDVDRIKTGTDIAINTNLATAMAPKSQILKRHLVMAENTFMDLFRKAEAP